MRLAALALCSALLACATAPAAPPAPSGYDAALAQRVGADERGMRQYVLVILKTGPATNLSDEERTRLFNGHMANINRLADEGRLVVAGPLGANERQYRGIFIFTVSTIEEAAALVATDPAVEAGVFAYEAYPWYGSAALMEIPALHERLRP
ncbi:YciI family protein [Vitreimonas flagellata]|uniref:YciI family protein n=1 Tax=Vitreimonas flagellata TaxID=2560861 RepID=UPI0010756AEC|nr:YciI family protein [Vitreimonas flagellata]